MVGTGSTPETLVAQSLNMALSLLSLHLTQASVSTEDWVRMQDYVSDLQVLSCYPDTRVARLDQSNNCLKMWICAIFQTNYVK